MPTYDYRFLRVEKADDGVATVTLARPEHRNAVNNTMHEELRDVWVQIGNDYEVRSVVLAADGPVFCAGGDLKDLDEQDEPYGAGNPIDPLVVMSADARRLARNMLDVEQPIIAAVHGHAYGLGSNIVLQADIIVMAEDARLADTHVNVGLVAGDGGPALWPLSLGPHLAKEYLLRGIPLTGSKAAELGMVNHAVPADNVHDVALSIARELAAGAPQAVRWTKYAVNKLIKDAHERVFDLAMALELTSMRSADHKEGVRAWRERRDPNFNGR